MANQIRALRCEFSGARAFGLPSALSSFWLAVSG
jgi:hypothetical protein